ncbi:hypothetical protein LCGC14_2342330 [marine sediment metagenome]|uniref:Uncharacterized protein n=1 Tax=marine sediment metagenome TaxID=412755 RepID=A0A0F9CBL5_9ZZZZ
MLYHTNDAIIDINASDGIANDLTGAVIDVENDEEFYPGNVSFLEESGILTDDVGLVIFMDDGSKFQIVVKELE